MCDRPALTVCIFVYTRAKEASAAAIIFFSFGYFFFFYLVVILIKITNLVADETKHGFLLCVNLQESQRPFPCV